MTTLASLRSDRWTISSVYALLIMSRTAPHVHSIEDLFLGNINPTSIFLAAVSASLFCGPFWVFAPLGLRYAPSFLKRTGLVVPFYLATVAVWGVWKEVRLLMPLYPTLIPLGLPYVYFGTESARQGLR